MLQFDLEQCYLRTIVDSSDVCIIMQVPFYVHPLGDVAQEIVAIWCLLKPK